MVKTQLYTGGSLLAAAAMYDGIVKGMADIGEASPSYNQGKFVEYELAQRPFSMTNSWVGTHAVNDYYNQFKFKEFSDTHVLFMYSVGPSLFMTTKPINTMEDLKGTTIRGLGASGDIVKTLGGIANSLAMGELYDAISKGVVSGVYSDAGVLIAFKLGDVVKYITVCDKAVGSSAIFWIAMNKNSWNELSADQQKVVNEVCNEWVEKAALAENQQYIDGIKYALQQGAQLIRLTDAETARWQAATSPLTDSYAADVITSKGFTADEAQARVKYLRERVSYWTDQQSKQGIESPW